MNPRLNNPLLKETDITRSIREFLARIGAFPIKMWGGGFQAPGISDLLICYQGRFIAIEVKKPGGRLTDRQIAFMDKVKRAGGQAFVACSLEDVIRELGLKTEVFPLFTKGAL